MFIKIELSKPFSFSSTEYSCFCGT